MIDLKSVSLVEVAEYRVHRYRFRGGVMQSAARFFGGAVRGEVLMLFCERARPSRHGLGQCV